jgi:hypothetical protein
MIIVDGKWEPHDDFGDDTLGLEDDEIVFVIAVGPPRDHTLLSSASTELYVSYVITRESVGWTSLYQHEEIT